MVSDVFDRNCYNVDMLYIAWRKWRNRRFRGFEPSYASFYSFSIVTMAVSCNIFEIKRGIDRKKRHLYASLYLTCTIS